MKTCISNGLERTLFTVKISPNSVWLYNVENLDLMELNADIMRRSVQPCETLLHRSAAVDSYIHSRKSPHFLFLKAKCGQILCGIQNWSNEQVEVQKTLPVLLFSFSVWLHEQILQPTMACNSLALMHKLLDILTLHLYQTDFSSN